MSHDQAFHLTTNAPYGALFLKMSLGFMATLNCHIDLFLQGVHLLVENTKIGAYATSHLKSDDKGEPQKKNIFRLLC